jgi:hypothetical protein
MWTACQSMRITCSHNLAELSTGKISGMQSYDLDRMTYSQDLSKDLASQKTRHAYNMTLLSRPHDVTMQTACNKSRNQHRIDNDWMACSSFI